MLFSSAGTQMIITFVKQLFYQLWLVNIIENISLHIRMKHNVYHYHRNVALILFAATPIMQID